MTATSGHDEATGVLNALKDRHGFAEWQRRSRLERNLFVWRYFLHGNEFTGWTAERIRSMRAKGWPPAIRSFWRADQDPDALVSLDVLECSSRAHAHETVIRLLAQSQPSELARDDTLPFGDVSFALPGHWAMIFARANLVVRAQNAGSAMVPVAELSGALDNQLVAYTRGSAAVPPEITSFRIGAGNLSPDSSVGVQVDASDPLGRPVWYRFFCRLGEVCLQEGTPIYRSANKAGVDRLTVVATNQDGGADSVARDVIIV